MKKMENKIGLIGYGAIGQQVEKLLLQDGIKYEDIFYFEDNIIESDTNKKFGFWDFLNPKFKNWYFLPTIGYLNISIKTQVLQALLDARLNLYSFIHPTVFLNPTAQIGRGVVVYPKSNIDQNVIIEDGVLINNSCVISHDSIIRRAAYISPGVVASGFVDIGEGCFVGSGSILSNGVKIGKNCRIGVGSCVTKNIPDNSNVIGNPLKIVSNLRLK